MRKEKKEVVAASQSVLGSGQLHRLQLDMISWGRAIAAAVHNESPCYVYRVGPVGHWSWWSKAGRANVLQNACWRQFFI